MSKKKWECMRCRHGWKSATISGVPWLCWFDVKIKVKKDRVHIKKLMKCRIKNKPYKNNCRDYLKYSK